MNFRNAICAFYASTTYASEYRAGLEFIRLAASLGFDLAIIADLDENSSIEILEAEAPGIKIVQIPSLVKRQSTLYRFSDLMPQAIWHLRVASWLRKQNLNLDCLWIQNGAQPWLPLTCYFGVSSTICWGPVGGGEAPTSAMMQRLPWRVKLREIFRLSIQTLMLARKFTVARKSPTTRLITIARTSEAQQQLKRQFKVDVPLIPEILDPVTENIIERTPAKSPRFIWVGQDIPRKNLPLALQIFETLRSTDFPDATLDIFGCESGSVYAKNGMTFHGWVSHIDWPSYQNDGILLLTSFREGLPSAVLEAVRHGLLCITADVGAIGGLGLPTVIVLPRDQYPNFNEKTFVDLAEVIRNHLTKSEIKIQPVSHRQKLIEFLKAEGVLP